MLAEVIPALIAVLVLIGAPVTWWIVDDWLKDRRVRKSRSDVMQRSDGLTRLQGGHGRGWWKD